MIALCARGEKKRKKKNNQKVRLSVDCQQLPACRDPSQEHAPPHVSQKPSYLFIPDAVPALGVGSSTAAGARGGGWAVPRPPLTHPRRAALGTAGLAAGAGRGTGPALTAASRAGPQGAGAHSALPRCSGPGRPAARAGTAQRPPLVGRSAPVAGRRESGLAPPRPAPPPAQAQT